MQDNKKINVNEKEVALIKQVFAGREEFLKSIRALFLGLGITEDEAKEIKATFSSEELRAIMWRRFYPQLSRNSPIGQVQDIWLGVEELVFDKMPSTIEQAVSYKNLALSMTKKALELLENPSGEAIDIKYDPMKYPMDEFKINLLARNMFIRHVENQLMFLWVIANQKTDKDEVNSKDSTV